MGLWHTGSVLRWKLVWAVLGTEGAFKGQDKVGMWLGAAPACWLSVHGGGASLLDDCKAHTPGVRSWWMLMHRGLDGPMA